MLEYLTGFFSTAILIMIGLIFFSAIIGILFKRRKRDRALKVFHNYHGVVTLENGLTIWGVIKVFKNSVEIVYDRPYEVHNSLQNSYILYDGDLENIQIIVRYDENLSKEQKCRRKRQLDRIISIGWLLRIWRTIVNFCNRLKDAFRQAVLLVLGQSHKRKKISPLVASEGKNCSEKIINIIDDNLYEEVLEQHIGEPVAVDIVCTAASSADKSAIIEIQGYLADYSDKFITIVNRDNIVKEFKIINVDKDINED